MNKMGERSNITIIIIILIIPRMIFIMLSIRDVPNIRFVFASVPNSAPNSVFIFGRIVASSAE